MTDRLADIAARIEGIKQLGSVVNAMKGIAAARARAARSEVAAVDSYANSIATAMAQVLRDDGLASGSSKGQTGVLMFAAEQGFAGAFSERVLDSLETTPTALFLIGTRGLSVAAAREITPDWHAAMPSHTSGIPKLADAITKAIYQAVASAKITQLDVVFTVWEAGRAMLSRHRLFPIDPAALPAAVGPLPLMQLPRASLIDSLGQDYFHAQVCKSALHAFAAENEARMVAMSSAASQISRELETFQATLRRVRQEAITAEIIELGTGAGQ
jgi:F-type H+-transporting ATPase subunit gamma